MKLRFVPLSALALLLCACSSFQSSSAFARRSVPPPVRAENKLTAFGEFPSYDPTGQYFKPHATRRGYEVVHDGRVVVDVIVNADGTIQDAAIVESSGNPEFDETALRLYKHSRYSLRLTRADPAPHVVRQEFISHNRTASAHIDTTNYRTMGPDVRATPGPYGNGTSTSTSSN